jgi:hypothetical protein
MAERGEKTRSAGSGARSPGQLYSNTQSVCKRYGIASDTLDRWARDKDFPVPYWFRGRRFWSNADLDAFDSTLQRGKDLKKLNLLKVREDAAA